MRRSVRRNMRRSVRSVRRSVRSVRRSMRSVRSVRRGLVMRAFAEVGSPQYNRRENKW